MDVPIAQGCLLSSVSVLEGSAPAQRAVHKSTGAYGVNHGSVNASDFDAEAVSVQLLELCWEKLHLGYWKDVPLAWREAYSLASLLDATLLILSAAGPPGSEPSSAAASQPDAPSGAVLDACMRQLDLGIMMGGPALAGTLQAMATALHGLMLMQRPAADPPEQPQQQIQQQRRLGVAASQAISRQGDTFTEPAAMLAAAGRQDDDAPASSGLSGRDSVSAGGTKRRKLSLPAPAHADAHVETLSAGFAAADGSLGLPQAQGHDRQLPHDALPDDPHERGSDAGGSGLPAATQGAVAQPADTGALQTPPSHHHHHHQTVQECQVPLPHGSLGGWPGARVPAADLPALEDFLLQYMLPQRPLVIHGARVCGIKRPLYMHTYINTCPPTFWRGVVVGACARSCRDGSLCRLHAELLAHADTC